MSQKEFGTYFNASVSIENDKTSVETLKEWDDLPPITRMDFSRDLIFDFLAVYNKARREHGANELIIEFAENE